MGKNIVITIGRENGSGGKEIAEKLAKGIPEVRIDLYEINGQVYFGEMTFFSQSRWDTDITYEADKIMGERIVLPQK